MQMEEWDAFDVNRVTQLTQGRPLEAVALEVLHRFNLLEKLKLPKQKLRSFLRVSSLAVSWACGNAAQTGGGGAGVSCGSVQEIEATYRRGNPYHNSTHAADVVQGLACMFAQNRFMAQLTDLEMLSMILACIMHDAGHPGVLSEPDDPCFAQDVCLMLPSTAGLRSGTAYISEYAVIQRLCYAKRQAP